MIPEETIFAHLSIRDWIRLRVVPHFSSGIVERTKHERAWKSTHARKGDTRRGERKKCRLFSRGVIFHARLRFARSTIPSEKWGTTRSLRLNERLFFLVRILILVVIKAYCSSAKQYVDRISCWVSHAAWQANIWINRWHTAVSGRNVVRAAQVSVVVEQRGSI